MKGGLERHHTSIKLGSIGAQKLQNVGLKNVPDSIGLSFYYLDNYIGSNIHNLNTFLESGNFELTFGFTQLRSPYFVLQPFLSWIKNPYTLKKEVDEATSEWFRIGNKWSTGYREIAMDYSILFSPIQIAIFSFLFIYYKENLTAEPIYNYGYFLLFTYFLWLPFSSAFITRFFEFSFSVVLFITFWNNSMSLKKKN
ncbi:hypothetical protein OAM21_02710 [Verrucomicrobia bacterium]|nr:hypothetical protein [Verrucomicrobiota bacterium]MDC0324084.1 hypothetical protein [Verrucomicrobiota bacterium]